MWDRARKLARLLDGRDHVAKVERGDVTLFSRLLRLATGDRAG